MSASKIPPNDTSNETSSAEDSFNQICTVRIELLDTDPLIWREVEVPTSITLDALADPEHPDHTELAEYLEDWDPKQIDELPFRSALGRIANRRNAARTRIAKKTT